MNDTLRFIFSAITAGACIGIAATTYLQLGGLGGCALFALGLMAVVYFELHLFTGKSQFCWGRRKKDNKDSLSYGRLTAILALNIIACAAMTLLSDPSGFIVDPGAIVGKRIADGWFESGIRSIPCGFIMTLSVRSARSGLWWPLIFGVPSFIICSFPHCVADIFYYAACAPSLSASDWVALAGVYPATVVGNYLGCNIYRSFSPKRQH